MNDINNGYDRHLDPPDEEEAVICEYCNQEMTINRPYKGIPYATCENQFCPEKFEKYKGGTIAVVLDMSNHLVEVEEKLKSTQDSLKYARARLSNVQLIRERREKTIEALETNIAYLEAQIDKHNDRVLSELTQSQQGEE